MTESELQELQWLVDDIGSIKGLLVLIVLLLLGIVFILALIHDRMYRRDKGL